MIYQTKKNPNKKYLQEKHSASGVLSTKVTEVIKIPLNSAVYSYGAIKENARIRNEQDADPLLKALKQRISHEEYDKHLKTEPWGRNLLRHEERIIMKDGGTSNAEVLRRRRISYTQPNHIPKTPSPRTLVHSAWKNKQTPRNYQNDTGMQSEILLPGSCTQNQSLGNQLSRLHCQQKN